MSHKEDTGNVGKQTFPMPQVEISWWQHWVTEGGSKRWTFSETIDIRDFTVCINYYPLCVSRRVDTWHIVYLSNKNPCPKNISS